MTVSVTFNAQMRDRLGLSDCAITLGREATVNEFLSALVQAQPRAAECLDGDHLKASILIFVNGRQIRDPKAAIPADATVSFQTPIAGG